MKKYLLFIFFSGWVAGAAAQGRPPGEDSAAIERLDSLMKILDHHPRKSKIRPFASIITPDAVAFKGLFNVYRVRDSIFIEVPDSLIQLPIMVLSTYVKSNPDQNGDLGYPGEIEKEQVIFFDLGRDSSIDLKALASTGREARPGSRIGGAVDRARTEPILERFTIAAVGPDHHSWLIDATSFLTRSNSVMTKINSNNVHIEEIKAFPGNVEVVVSSVPAAGNRNLLTMNYSFVGLSRKPMLLRLTDPRIGFFPGSREIEYFSDEQQRVRQLHGIKRWRLEPRPEDMEKWRRGELVEPAKPIIYYIDPNTPRQWVPYLIAGVDDWRAAFEQAGFKNAITAKEWPANTPFDLRDSRFSVLCYLPSPTPNAYGSPTADPRSGEIVQSHIGWYHNVMVILNGWYKTQVSSLDAEARVPTFDDSLMGELIRFVSSHEIGHTLGLAHNHGSSSQTPVEKLRDVNWLRAHGHTASIMDYARFNYVAQPEDSIPQRDLWPRIGEYDRWAIQWGYSYTGLADPYEDRLLVSRWATDSLASNPLLWFGSEETDVSQLPGGLFLPADPRVQTECVGDDNMIGNAYGLKNFHRVMSNFPTWDHAANGTYEDWEEVYGWIQWTLQKHWLPQVEAYIGGRYRTYKSEEAVGDVYAPVPKSQQKEALKWLNDQLFTTPLWWMDSVVVNKIVAPEETNFIGSQQQSAIRRLLDVNTLYRLTANIQQFGLDSTYGLDEYFRDVHGYVWDVIKTGASMDFYRRNLQASYVTNLGRIVSTVNEQVKEEVLWAAARRDMIDLYHEIEAALKVYGEGPDRDHLETMKWRIAKIFSAKVLFN